MPVPGSILGNAVVRVEDPGILVGETRYVDDIAADGVLHLAFVRSTIAHARIESIDVEEARAMPGVVAVYTAADLDLPTMQGMQLIDPVFNRPPLAVDRVRFVGDAIVAIVAETRGQAMDAAEMVIVDYDPLPAVVDPIAALEPDAPVLFPDHGSNLVTTFGAGGEGSALDGADVVVEARIVNQRISAAPMEPNGILVERTDAGGLDIHLSTQAPHQMRDGLAGALGLEADQVRVVAPAVGGGFGAKMHVYVEFAIASRIAQLLGRPVKWVETRSESMVAMHHGRGQVQDVRLGVRRDGTIVGLEGRIHQDAGAYPAMGAFLTYFTRMMAAGVYRVPNVQLESLSVATTTTPVGAFRGAGRPEATTMIERLIDMAAVELGMDPAEIRRRNFIGKDEFPHTTVAGATYDIGDYELALDEVLRLADYDALRAEQAERRARGDQRLLGIGVSTYVEITAGGTGHEFASVEVLPDGTIEARVGTSSHGQGHETAFKMLLADLFRVPMERIRIVQSDTATVPRGVGTMGSRSLQIGGSAISTAGEQVIAKARLLAAHLLRANADDLTITPDCGLSSAGGQISWPDLAAAALDASSLPEGMEPGLAYEHDWSAAPTFPFGAHVAVVEVDAETGKVELVRHVSVDDAGRIINPLLVLGQQHGGIAQGVAQALWEQVTYDEDGNPLTVNFMDYAVPSAAELPSFEATSTETPTPNNPLGAKGIGESGTIGATPAVQNAVIDALAHLGVRHLDMPLTPERVWRAIDEATA